MVGNQQNIILGRSHLLAVLNEVCQRVGLVDLTISTLSTILVATQVKMLFLIVIPVVSQLEAVALSSLTAPDACRIVFLQIFLTRIFELHHVADIGVVFFKTIQGVTPVNLGISVQVGTAAAVEHHSVVNNISTGLVTIATIATIVIAVRA